MPILAGSEGQVVQNRHQLPVTDVNRVSAETPSPSRPLEHLEYKLLLMGACDPERTSLGKKIAAEPVSCGFDFGGPCGTRTDNHMFVGFPPSRRD